MRGDRFDDSRYPACREEEYTGILCAICRGEIVFGEAIVRAELPCGKRYFHRDCFECEIPFDELAELGIHAGQMEDEAASW